MVMNSGGRNAYVPAIDGLRAVAVLSVLFFHLGGWLPSGFVGVDVFFVISGYVVASAAKDLPTVNLRSFVTAFYARRLLRIAPALICCLMVTMLVMACIVPVTPDGRLTETNTKTGLAAFWGFSNFVLAGSSNDYWSPHAELNPFTHTWSLAIEEQFYLVFPMVYFAWLRGKRLLARVTIICAVVASLGAAAALSDQTVFSFYMLPTRFWELGLGVSLFFFRDSLTERLAAAPRGIVEAGAAVALLALLSSLFLTDATHFPWPGALVPVVAVAVLIASILARPDTQVARLLALRPIVQIGKISYSLYLWHWPVIVFGRWTSGMHHPGELLAALMLSWLLAYLSYRYVECPIRYSKSLPAYSRGALAATAVAVVGVSFAGAIGIAINRSNISLSVTKDPLNWRWDGVWPSEHAACSAIRSKSSFDTGRQMTFLPQGCTSNARTLYVAGDSHAGAYTAMLDLYARESGAKVQLYGRPGCGFFNLRRKLVEEAADCQAFVRAVVSDIRKNAKAGDLLFLPGLRVARYQDQGVPGKAVSTAGEDVALDAAIVDEARAILQPLADVGVRVILEAPKPVLKAPPFRCSDPFNKANPICQAGLLVPRTEAELHREAGMRRVQALASRMPTASVWDPLPVLCPDGLCGSADPLHPLLFDGDHISGFANRQLATGFIDRFGTVP